MDGSRFDGVAKSLASDSSRRSILKGLAGGSLAAVFGLRTSGVSAGACKERRRKCRSADQCCGGKTACRQVDEMKSVAGVITTCNLDGRRCCGLEGAMCENGDSCGCCSDLVCNSLDNRCTLPDLLPS